jgi:drug/metabolite transporter (DMT)-like permease
MQRGVPGRIFVASVLGTYIGIWLSHISAEYYSLAIATTQMSTTPIFMVLLVGIFLRKKISMTAFLGMVLAIVGVAILMQPTGWNF